MINLNIQQIFSVPFYSTTLNNSIIKYMEDLIVPKLDYLPFTDENVYTDYYQKNKIINSSQLKPFYEVVNPIIKEFSKKSNIIYRSKVEYWIQDYKMSNTHKIHAHPGNNISGIYYIRSNDHAGNIEFFSPNPHTYFTNSYPNTVPSDRFIFKPQPGLFLLFPSYLFHQIQPSSNPSCVRTCLAFNC